MKRHLNEKFTLEELHTLTEESNEDKAIEHIRDIKQILRDIAAASNTVETVLKRIVAHGKWGKALVGITDEISNATNAKKISELAIKFNSTIEELSKESAGASWKNKYKNLFDLIEDIKSLVATIESHPIGETKNSLKAIFNKVGEALRKNALVIDEDTANYGSLIGELTNTLLGILSGDKLSTLSKSTLRLIAQELGKYAPYDIREVTPEELKALATKLKLIIDSINEYLAREKQNMHSGRQAGKEGDWSNADEAVDSIELETDADEIGPSYWYRLWTNSATNGNNVWFWEKYFEEEWKSNKSKAKELGPAFTQELEKLGFDESSNKFIAFVKKLFAAGVYPKRDQYSAIHNSFIQGYITREDLIGNKLPNVSILYNKNLYDLELIAPSQIEEYLQLHKIATTAAYAKATRTRVLRDKYKNLQDYYIDLFYVPGNTIINNPIRQEGNTAERIKEISRIDKEIQSLGVVIPVLQDESNSRKNDAIKNFIVKVTKEKEIDGLIEFLLSKTPVLTRDRLKQALPSNFNAKKPMSTQNSLEATDVFSGVSEKNIEIVINKLLEIRKAQ